jgi:competence protein ComGC
VIGDEIFSMQGASAHTASHRPAKRAFTLVEAMVLLVIIAFLLAMAVMALQRIRQKNQEDRDSGRHAQSSLNEWRPASSNGKYCT